MRPPATRATRRRPRRRQSVADVHRERKQRDARRAVAGERERALRQPCGQRGGEERDRRGQAGHGRMARGLAVECPAFYMERRPDTIAARARGAAIACGLALALAVVMTWPLAAGLGRLGRTTTMDGLYGIWNVAWVAARIVTDPAALFDANIFYPHRSTLAYSEANIVAGVVGDPGMAAHAAMRTPRTTAPCCSRSRRRSSARGCSRGVCRDDSDAAGVAAILFAFCPYFYSHSAHIQLLMAGGIPLSMLALHRLVGRAVAGARRSCSASRSPRRRSPARTTASLPG